MASFGHHLDSFPQAAAQRSHMDNPGCVLVLTWSQSEGKPKISLNVLFLGTTSETTTAHNKTLPFLKK